MRRLICALLALVVVAACRRWEDRYLKREVRSSEIVGQWVLTPGTVKDLRKLGYTEPIDAGRYSFILRGDHTCSFHTFPKALTTRGTPNVPVDRECIWSFRASGIQALIIDCVDSPRIQTHYYFDELEGAIILWQFADDPDTGRYVEYLRRPV